MISCAELRSYLVKLPGNNKDSILGHFKNIDGKDGLLCFLPETARIAFKEEISEKREYYEKECSSKIDSGETISLHADALCFRTKQKLERHKNRTQVVKCQTIIEAIALKLRMWVYPDETNPKYQGM